MIHFVSFCIYLIAISDWRWNPFSQKMYFFSVCFFFFFSECINISVREKIINGCFWLFTTIKCLINCTTKISRKCCLLNYCLHKQIKYAGIKFSQLSYYDRHWECSALVTLFEHCQITDNWLVQAPICKGVRIATGFTSVFSLLLVLLHTGASRRGGKGLLCFYFPSNLHYGKQNHNKSTHQSWLIKPFKPNHLAGLSCWLVGCLRVQ